MVLRNSLEKEQRVEGGGDSAPLGRSIIERRVAVTGIQSVGEKEFSRKILKQDYPGGKGPPFAIFEFAERGSGRKKQGNRLHSAGKGNTIGWGCYLLKEKKNQKVKSKGRPEEVGHVKRGEGGFCGINLQRREERMGKKGAQLSSREGYVIQRTRFERKGVG